MLEKRMRPLGPVAKEPERALQTKSNQGVPLLSLSLFLSFVAGRPWGAWLGLERGCIAILRA